jgi:glycosyltransferase involved in cell wall biosynthesis
MATRGRPERMGPVVEAALLDEGVAQMVVVVDGEDDEATWCELCRLAEGRPKLLAVRAPRQGQLGALDEGVARASSEVLVLLDDDVVPGPGLASGHARHHATRDGLVVVGAMPVVLTGATIGTILYAGDYEQYRARLSESEVRVLDHLWLGNVSLRRADAQRIGLRSAHFTASYHADRELGFRLGDAGLVGVFDESLRATHLHVRADGAFVRDALRRGAGVARLHELYPERLGPLSLDELVDGVPRPLRALVRRLGASGASVATARLLLGMARVCRVARWRRGEVAAAQVARRLLFCRGALVGEP